MSHHIPRSEICRIFHSVRRESRNMIKGYASQLLLLPFTAAASWESIQYPGRLVGPGKIHPTESGNGKRWSNVMNANISVLIPITLSMQMPGPIFRYRFQYQYQYQYQKQHQYQCHTPITIAVHILSPSYR